MRHVREGAWLELSLALDKTNVRPGQKTGASVVVSLRAEGAKPNAARPLLTVAFVLDVSGSMRGPPLEHVISSVERLIGLLSPTDQVAIVTFNHSAAVAVSLRPADPDTKRLVHNTLVGLAAGASTNLEAGMRLAFELLPNRRENERQLVILLSDGVPNTGLCTPLTLAELTRGARSGASVWTLGYGPHHHEDILAAISAAGGGRYEYVPQPQISEQAFARVLGAQGLVVADSIELTLRPTPGVEVHRVLGKHDMRYAAGGLVFHIPDFFTGAERTIVAELTLTPPTPWTPWRALSATLAYRASESEELRSVARDLLVPVSDSAPGVAETAVAGVLLARCDDVRAEARAMADRGQFEGAAALLGEMVRAIEAAPRYSALDGSPLSEAREELRDELMVMDQKPKAEEYRAYRRSQVNVSVSSRDFAIPSMSAQDNVYANEVMRAVAGNYPVASLEQVSGREQGRTLALSSEQVIGRATSSSIVLADPRVTRHHTKIIAQRGTFFAIDLGSANGTWVNGFRVESHPLRPGDILDIGGVRFRYTEHASEAEPRLMAIASDGNVYVVEKDKLFVIGSSRACTMVIESPKVGRRHAAIRYRDGGYWLEDYGSAGGTFRPDGAQLTDRCLLREGDELLMGDARVRFTFRPRAAVARAGSTRG